MAERQFRFYREDFPDIPVRVIHMDLVFDVYDDHTRVISDLHLSSKDAPLPEIALNARNLEILSVNCPEHPCTHTMDAEANLLRIRFGQPVPPNAGITLHTESICRPTKNILEGLYYDETPPGAPPQLITQCQQWGFQRLVPCIDDMTAKCTYTTTIFADERYTDLISNGDVISPRQPAGPGRVTITYGNTVTPMAPYLFLLCCGTFARFGRDCEYPGGHRYRLELLVPPASGAGAADYALDILSDAVLWVNLFTGPGMYREPSVRERMYELATEMNRAAARNPGSPRIAEIREELKGLLRMITVGYAYTGSVYREIAMQNSDFGGMENVGNTTITANRIMPFPAMTDPAFEYLVRVKAHEFYHNLNGSEVTGRSPFEIWLNEAVTVHVENQYHAFRFGKEYSRLQDVISLLAPAGTLELDSGAAALPVEPQGFNDPNELITDITYRKAPEFVRMIETLMGKEAFARGLDLYHTRYRHGNATRAQWVEAMEEVSGQKFSSMADGWLRQTGYPTLTVTATWDPGQKVTILNLKQEGDRPEKSWIFPFRAAVADPEGRDMGEVVYRVEKRVGTLEIPSPEKPAFLSLNRDFSFYGKLEYNPPVDELYLQAERDSDIVNRWIAFTKIADRQKRKLLSDPEALPETAFTGLLFRLFTDKGLMMQAGPQLLTIFESAPEPESAHRYRALWEVRERLLRACAVEYRTGLESVYKTVHLPEAKRLPLSSEHLAIRRRQVKNTALALLARAGDPDVLRLIREQFEEALNASDRLTAFALYMDSTAGDRSGLVEKFMEESRKHPVAWENFLSVIAGNSSPEALEFIGMVEQSPSFRIEQANDQRSLYLRFALNRKLSLQTEAGRAFLEKALFRLAPVNEHTVVGMLRVFGPLDAMEESDQVPLAGILVRLIDRLDPAKTPSVRNTARRILAGSPRAIAAYKRYAGTGPEPHPVSRSTAMHR